MNSMFISNITEAEVTETILDLNNSSPGYDEVPAIVMKQNIHALIKPLTYLINCSINKGIFPDELKIAKVIQYNAIQYNTIMISMMSDLPISRNIS